jgi:hypothetical protein
VTTVSQQTNPIRIVDLGTLRRGRNGQFAKTFALSYETRDWAGDTVKVLRHLPAASVELLGKVISRAGERGQAWNIQVLDGDDDVTFDFECFQD